jgi:hypothetical protein
MTVDQILILLYRRKRYYEHELQQGHPDKYLNSLTTEDERWFAARVLDAVIRDIEKQIADV